MRCRMEGFGELFKLIKLACAERILSGRLAAVVRQVANNKAYDLQRNVVDSETLGMLQK